MRSALFLSSIALFTAITGRQVLIPQLPDISGGSSSSVSSAVGCKVAGCSGELCVDAYAEDVVSTCIWKDSYACYKTARCERQLDGQCDWTETPELNACLHS